MSHSAERWEWGMEHHFPFAPRRKSVMRMPCWQRCCHGLGRVRVWWGREGGMKRWVTDEGTSRQEAGTMDAGLHSYVMWGHKLQVNKTHNAGKKRRFLALLGRKKLLNSGICSKLHIKGIYFIKTLKRIQKSSQFWTCWHSILQQETYDRRMEGQLCSLYSCSLISI